MRGKEVNSNIMDISNFSNKKFKETFITVLNKLENEIG